MEPYRKTFEETVIQFLEQTGCRPVKQDEKLPARSGDPDLLACCNGRMIAIWLEAPGDRATEPRCRERADFPGRYGILLSPDRFEIFRNFINCILAGDMTNAGYNYDLLWLSRKEMSRLVR